MKNTDRTDRNEPQAQGRLLPTTVVGSYPQPEWLIDRRKLQDFGVPRVRAPEIWRVTEDLLERAQDDATLIAIHEMERAGVDIITDGEMRRESYSNRFSTALEGIDISRPSVIVRAGHRIPVPRIVGKIRRTRPVEVSDIEFLRRNTDRMIKATLPGPFTMAQQAQNDFYADPQELLMDLAGAVNLEVRDLKAAGADVIQLDEPWLRMDPKAADLYAVPAIDRALDGVEGPTAVHLCFGYAQLVKDKPAAYSFLQQLGASNVGQISLEAAQPNIDLGVLKDLSGKTIILGVVSIDDATIETPEEVASRIRKALSYVAKERLIPAPDCGMKYLSREIAFSKLQALVQGAAIVRSELL
jgi:5-methyltetrahydropteroyltriglutamate--homocysteine methyltransferase